MPASFAPVTAGSISSYTMQSSGATVSFLADKRYMSGLSLDLFTSSVTVIASNKL